MPVKCKYCGNRESTIWLVWVRFVSGEWPPCSHCGAADDTLEVGIDEPE